VAAAVAAAAAVVDGWKQQQQQHQVNSSSMQQSQVAAQFSTHFKNAASDIPQSILIVIALTDYSVPRRPLRALFTAAAAAAAAAAHLGYQPSS
jgi:hypothetical protein